jgi:2-C-methyl-D-erythritol 4-phosphate cytidylyltransferase
MNYCIVLASGVGKRMGAGKNKTLLRLGKRPLIFYTLENFQKAEEIDEIILVVKKEELETFGKIVIKYRLSKVVAMVAGGKERQDSAENGMNFIRNNFDVDKNSIVIFHNGANPFVSQDEIKKVIAGAKKFGAAAVAQKTKDTIRQVDGQEFSKGVIDRKQLRNMQTPQALKFSLALKAFSQAKRDKFLGTDDVSLAERLGKKVKIIEASENNFKVTTPLDLKLAEIILKSNAKKYV